MSLTIIILNILLVHRSVLGMHFPFGRDSNDSSVSLEAQSIERALMDGALTQATEENSRIMITDENDENNSTLASGNQSLPSTYSSSSVPSTSSIHNGTAVFSNESQSLSSTQSSSNESFAATTTFASNVTSSTTEDDEPEGVARGKPSSTESVGTTTTQPQTLYEKTWALISDTYTLSILVPVAAGVVFATTVILTIAICKCLRRRCVRRRLRRKALPDSVKSLRPSDRARLLAESSDEEF